MNTRRLRLVRPRWTLGTMLLIVGWSAVVVWLNVRPRLYYFSLVGEEPSLFSISHGCPWIYAFHPGFHIDLPSRSSLREALIYEYWPLTANIGIGLLAVAVLTFASKYLVRAIVAGLRAVLSKPPPSDEKGP